MKLKDQILNKLTSLINETRGLLNQVVEDDYNEDPSVTVKFYTYRTSALSFLKITLGQDNIYFNDFLNSVRYYKPYNLKYALELLERIRTDVNDGWLTDIKSLISGEIYSDFIEMAEDLLDQGYKDAAAVITGSVLEENIRQLCILNNISTHRVDAKSGKDKPLKADTMNAELSKANIYNNLVQKSITANLDLRNKAAHGKYDEYDRDQVRLMLHSVIDFTSKYL